MVLAGSCTVSIRYPSGGRHTDSPIMPAVTSSSAGRWVNSHTVPPPICPGRDTSHRGRLRDSPAYAARKASVKHSGACHPRQNRLRRVATSPANATTAIAQPYQCARMARRQ